MMACHPINAALVAVFLFLAAISSASASKFSRASLAFLPSARRSTSPTVLRRQFFTNKIHLPTSSKPLLSSFNIKSREGDDDDDDDADIPQRQNNDSINSYNEVFLISMDGTLASTTRSRSFFSICAALKLWPSLQNPMETLGMDSSDFDWDTVCSNGSNGGDATKNNDTTTYEWLLQKLDALSSIAQQGNDPDTLLGVDSVLLARLLIEEQLLDGGRSNGCTGKYGGKFHPSSSALDEDNVGADADATTGSNVGSRPLTVGELYANWHELKHVTRNKYPAIINGKMVDPVPEIRNVLNEMFSLSGILSSDLQDQRADHVMKDLILPSWFPLAYDSIFDYQNDMKVRQNIMILLGHESQLTWALSSLTLLGCSLDVCIKSEELEHDCRYLDVNQLSSSEGDKMKVIVTNCRDAWKNHEQRLDGNNDECNGPSLLLIVPEAQNEQSHSETLRQIVMDASTSSQSIKNVCILHSSLDVLKNCKSFVGEDVPLLSDGLRKCNLFDRDAKCKVTFCLPEWGNVHPSQYNDAEMDPWLNVLLEEEFVELVSAKIVEAPLSAVGSG